MNCILSLKIITMDLLLLKSKMLEVKSLSKQLSKKMKQIETHINNPANENLLNLGQLVNQRQEEDGKSTQQKVEQKDTDELGILSIQQDLESNVEQEVQICCNQVFDKPKEALNHLIKYHNDISQKINCKFCKSNFYGYKSLIDHQMKNHKYLLEIGNKTK
ncbi:hypothetical protein pb186bvf_003630 [Paramecium bursaria]